MDRDGAFDVAVKLIRRGESSLEIENRLEGEMTGGGSIPKLLAEARRYVEELQQLAFAVCVDSFKAGESFNDVLKKLFQLGFQAYDAECLAERAQKKATEEGQ